MQASNVQVAAISNNLTSDRTKSYITCDLDQLINNWLLQQHTNTLQRPNPLSFITILVHKTLQVETSHLSSSSPEQSELNLPEVIPSSWIQNEERCQAFSYLNKVSMVCLQNRPPLIPEPQTELQINLSTQALRNCVNRQFFLQKNLIRCKLKQNGESQARMDLLHPIITGGTKYRNKMKSAWSIQILLRGRWS